MYEAEPAEGVWSVWGEWSQCSQTCGVGVSQRNRKCLAPPPPQSPPLSHSPPNWAGYVPGGNRSPVSSPLRPFYSPRHPGQHVPYHASPYPNNHNQGLPLYRNSPSEGGGVPAQGQSNPSSSLYQPEFSPTSQDPIPVYQSPYHSSHNYNNQPARVMRRPPSPAASRSGGGSNRRSVSTNREAAAAAARRPSPIRPGQFGYGRVPFSLPLHRQNRQARHTLNGTELDVSVDNDRTGEEKDTGVFETAQESTFTEKPTTTTTTTRRPHRHVVRQAYPDTRRRERVPPYQFSRSSSPSVLSSHRSLDWNSVTAPPPPVPPLSHPNSPGSPYSPPLHRPNHANWEREHQPPTGNVYPLQHPNVPYGGAAAGHERGRVVFRCSGSEREYRRCFSQVCAGGGRDTRAEQCAAFNDQEFMGRLYNWEPFTEVGPDKQCELTCRPSGYRFYVRQAERVRDGTSCFNSSANDVCVEGQCLSEGCDGILGSGAVIDRCGVCGGRETSCRKVTGSFQNATVPLGYHKILDIPAGATFINITERRASPNYLAMRSGTGASVVNGRWAVDPPGEYKAGGTTFTYIRPKALAEGEEERGETLTAPGPTTTQLQLYIIFHQKNPGIDYEYYVPVEKKESEREGLVERVREPPRERPRERPREQEPAARAPLRGPLTVSVEEPANAPPVSNPSSPSSSSVFSAQSAERWTPERAQAAGRGAAPNRNVRIPPRTDLPLDTQSPFVWRRGALTECTASCGKGFQYREILCINRHTDQEEPDRKCDSAAKPAPEEEPCNTHPCPPFWETSSWSECSVSCGPGLQQRQLQCRQSFGNRSTMVHPQRCASLTPPQSMQPCQLRMCSHWEVSSDWSSCSVDCGVGSRTRSVRCVSEEGSVVNDKECNSRLKPQGSEECNMGPCVTNWYFSDWAQTCSAQCGPGVQKREVVCLTRGDVKEGDGGEDSCVAERPAEMKACNGGPCAAVTMWYTSPWTQCNVRCGSGTQRRDIVCVQKTGSDFSVVASTECSDLEKPAPVQECDMGECLPQWFTTEWSACSRSCGKGLQMREVRCLTADKKHSLECNPASKPEQEQFCNTIPCSPQVADENCKDRRHNCVMVVQARLCVYSYYKTACCASCTQSAQRTKRH